MKPVTRCLSIFIISCSLLVGGCIGKPEGIEPITDFKVDSFLGTWYEIARFDHSFESGLSKVTATYSMRKDGGIKVVNRGYAAEKAEWKEAIGKAYFVEDKNKAHLKVSFFGPFYSSYIIVDRDEHQRYVLVTGADRSYLWILSRTPTIPEDVKNDLLTKATALGFDINKLHFVDQY